MGYPGHYLPYLDATNLLSPLSPNDMGIIQEATCGPLCLVLDV